MLKKTRIMKRNLTSLLTLLFISTVFLNLLSCNHKKKIASNSYVEDTTAVIIDEPINQSIKEFGEEGCKEKITEFFKRKFGRFSKVTKWGKGGVSIRKDSYLISGTVIAVVRGDKSTYTFDAILGQNGEVFSMQMNHKGTMDCFYNYVDGQRLDDNTIKSTFKFNGITLRTIGIREAGVRYVTSQIMSKEQIMKFIVNETDLQRSNYYFQKSQNALEYAQYCGDDKSGFLTTYNNGKSYNVTISESGKVSFK